MLSFDHILETHIQTGLVQFEAIIVVGLIELCDGIEYAFMTILMTILKTEWNLTQSEVASLGSSFLLGVVLGNFLCAYIADHIGRKTTFTIFSGLSVLIVFYTSLSHSYLEILIMRLCFGIVFGTTTPLGYVFITEIVVAKYRGRYTFSLTLCYVVGKIYLMSLCYIFLDDYTSGNWRGLIRFNMVPVLIAFLASIFFLQETVRFSLNRGWYQRAFREIEDISRRNNVGRKVTNEEKDGVIRWQINQNRQTSKMNILGLFSKQYREITIKLWVLVTLANYINMSMYLLLPFLFHDHNQGFGAMLMLFLVEFLASFFIYFFIDNPQYGGRVKILIGSCLLLFICNFSLYFFRENVLFIGLLGIKIGTRALFSTSYILTTESYPLKFRSEGAGLAQGVGKLISIPSPYIIFPLYFIDPYLPFGLMTIFCLISILIAISYPVDKTLQYLETSDHDTSHHDSSPH